MTGTVPPAVETPASSKHSDRALAHSLVNGISSVGIATTAERGLGFLAHLLAARIGGTGVFGAYSLALTTANSVATYAGAGIGATANRFSGMYPYGSPQYPRLQRTLAIISTQSAALAGLILWSIAGFLATRLVRNPALGPLLRLGALSAAAIILLECMRGFLVGQRRYTALLALSLAGGAGMLLAVPAAARIGPRAMIAGQASAATLAVLVCVLFARRLAIRSTAPAEPREEAGGRLRYMDVWLFGAGQLFGVIGLNAAGLWTASLVGRADQTLLQMSLYVAATQIRNVIAMVPGLVQQSCYALLTEEAGGGYGGPGRVLVASTLLAAVLALVLTGTAIAVLPWALGLLYGKAFRGAEPAAALAIATALVHMAGAPAVSRLTILSLRLIAIVNAVWAVGVIALAPVFIPRGGAVPATAILLAMHLLSAILVLAGLWKRRALPRGLLPVSLPMMAGSCGLALLAWIRWTMPNLRGELSLAILVLTAALIGLTLAAGHAAGCAPRLADWRRLPLGPAARMIVPEWARRRSRGLPC